MKSAILILVAVCVGATYWGAQQDDAYIFYSYALNMIQGAGYVFNDGEHVNATTSPLYTLLLAIFAFPFPPLLPAVGHVIGIVSLIGISLLSFEYFNRDYTAVLFPLLLMTHPWLYNGAGMESYLALALTLGMFAAYKADKMTLAAVLAAFAFLARPDTILAAMILGIDYLWTKRRLPPLRVFWVGLLILIPWFVFSYMYFGNFLPSTLSAKSAQSATGYWGTGLIFLKGLAPSGHLVPRLFVYGWFLLCLVSGVIVLSRKPQIFRSLEVRLILLWNLLYLVVYGLVLNPPAYPWYYVPFVSGMALLAALAANEVWNTRFRYLVVVAVICALFVPLGMIRWNPQSSKYAIYQRVAIWLNENANPGDDLASAEIGVLRYFYKHGRIIDTLGLVEPAIAESIRNQDYGWYVEYYQPEWILVREPARSMLEDYSSTSDFQSHYVPAEADFSGYKLYRRNTPNRGTDVDGVR